MILMVEAMISVEMIAEEVTMVEMMEDLVTMCLQRAEMGPTEATIGRPKNLTPKI